MGRFVGTGDERTMVNSYIDSYLKGTNEYAKYLQSAPNFVTYYSRDQEHSTENSGLGDVEEIIGDRSPLRYNRVNNIPLYMVEDAAPELMTDGVLGLGYNVESTAVIIPNTVIPVPNDVFIFSYWEQDKNQKVLFRVTNVTTTAVDSNAYYQINFQSTPYDFKILEERQLVDRYEVIYDHIASGKPAIVVEKDYILAEEVGKVFDQVAEIYIEDYYSPTLNFFLHDSVDETGKDITYFDRTLHEFLREQKFFINSKTLVQNILLEPLKVPRVMKMYSPFRKVGEADLGGGYDTTTSGLEIFKLFPLQVLELTYLPLVDKKVEFLPEVLRVYKEFFPITPETTGQSIEEKLEGGLLDEINEFLEDIIPSMEGYLSLPILLYTLNWVGEYLVRGRSLGGESHG